MTDPAALTDEELAQEFGHHREGSIVGNPLTCYCRVCSRTWPCPTARLIAALRASRAEVETLRAFVHTLSTKLDSQPRNYDDSELTNEVARRGCDRAPCSCGMHRDRT